MVDHISCHFIPFPISPTLLKTMLFTRSARLISRRRLVLVTSVITTTAGAAGVYMATRPYNSVVHAESQGLKLWDTLPGENATVKSGLAKLRGKAAEEHFRTALVNNGKTDFDVVIGM